MMLRTTFIVLAFVAVLCICLGLESWWEGMRAGPRLWLWFAIDWAIILILAVGLYFEREPVPYTPFHPDYASKCKRRRLNGPTPCLCCEGECVG